MTKKPFLISNVKILSLVFLPSLLFSQDILWERSYGGKHAEFLYDAIPTPDYGFLLAGSGNVSDLVMRTFYTFNKLIISKS